MVPIKEESVSRMITEGNPVRVKGRVQHAVLRLAFVCDWSRGRAAAGRGDRWSVDVASGRCVGVSAEPVLKVVKLRSCRGHTMFSCALLARCIHSRGGQVGQSGQPLFLQLGSHAPLHESWPRPRVLGFSPLVR